MSRAIVVTIDETGEASVTTTGYTGQACRQATAGVEKALGTVVSRKDTPDAFKVSVGTQVKAGVSSGR